MTELALIVLLIVFVCREMFYQYTTQKLINKIMSKNYHDYSQSVDRVAMEELNLKKHMVNNQLYNQDLDHELSQQQAILSNIR